MVRVREAGGQGDHFALAGDYADAFQRFHEGDLVGRRERRIAQQLAGHEAFVAAARQSLFELVADIGGRQLPRELVELPGRAEGFAGAVRHSGER